jgi:hypothetical protein
MSVRRLHGLNFVNGNGGLYHPGVHAYIACFHHDYPYLPMTTAVAKKAKVCRTFASQVIQEFLLSTGTLIDPEIIKQQ